MRHGENYLTRLSFVEPRLSLGHFATSFVDFVAEVGLGPLCVRSWERLNSLDPRLYLRTSVERP